MKKVFGLSVLFIAFFLGLCVWSNPLNLRIGSPKTYMVISRGPSISCNASGTLYLLYSGKQHQQTRKS